MKNVRGTLNSLGLFNRNSPTQQLILGAISGYGTGYLAMKVSKKAAFLVGGGIIIFQLGQNQGLTKTSWHDASKQFSQVTQKLQNSLNTKGWKSKAMDFTGKNTCFAASFVGGFLMGAASK